jgi:hypothetical protein
LCVFVLFVAILKKGAEAEDMPGLCLAVFGSVSPVLFDPDTDTDPDPDSHTHALTHIPTHAFPSACVMICGAAGTPLPYPLRAVPMGIRLVYFVGAVSCCFPVPFKREV